MSKKNFKLGERVFVDGSGVSGLVGDAWGGSEGVVTHEANWMEHVLVRLDNAPTPFERVHDQQNGLWCDHKHVFYVKHTFKVGDEVFVAKNGVVGCNPSIWNGSKGIVTAEVLPDKNVVRVKLNHVPHGFYEMHDATNGLWCKAKNVYALEREKPKNEVPSPCEIRMSFVGNATTMSLVDTDGKVKCSATARCHPNDEFSVAEGMGIAFERLYQKYREQNPEHSAIMVGDKVRVIKGAALPLVTSYGKTKKPCEIVLNEVGTVTSLSPNSVNAIVEWRENVVAAVATASLEIVREPKAKPKYREDFVKPLHEREPVVGEKVFVLSNGVKHDYGLTWYSEETIANEGRFCVVRGWYTNPRTRKRYAIVEHADGSASIDPDYILLLD